MKFFRNIAYGIIALCMLGCIAILFYSGSASKRAAGSELTISDSEPAKTVEVENGEVKLDDVYQAAQVIISDVKDDVLEKVNSISSSVFDATSKEGEISYEEIVRLQEEEALREQKLLVAESNEKNSISSNDSSVTRPASTPAKTYSYVANKTTKKLHKVGCTLEPLGDNAEYYEKLSEALADGYTDRCTICSP